MTLVVASECVKRAFSHGLGESFSIGLGTVGKMLYHCAVTSSKGVAGLVARNVGATTAPINEQRFFFFHLVLRKAWPFYGGPCGAFEKMHRPYVRSTNLHGLSPHLVVRGRFQPCNVGANHG